jgi:hypothetical protein
MDYNQCHLTRSHFHQIAYIPSKFAQVGRMLKLKDENGWVVQDVYSKYSENKVMADSRDYKETRKASDM